MSCQQSQNSVANFIQKSFEILENKEYESIIHWMNNGREFAIKEIEEFQNHILPKFFRHRNINSFIRQLNMYGFHKSRKDPSKNIFSHPFFLRGQPQILHLVKRKIKSEDKPEEETKLTTSAPLQKQENQQLEPLPSDISSKKSLTSMTIFQKNRPERCEKEVLPTKTEIAGTFTILSFRSFGLGGIIEVCPLKGLMEKSCIMDSNPDFYLKMREHNSMWHGDIIVDDDDNVSIQDEIQKERRVFMNRRSGVSILPTYNLLEDFDFE